MAQRKKSLLLGIAVGVLGTVVLVLVTPDDWGRGVVIGMAVIMALAIWKGDEA